MKKKTYLLVLAATILMAGLAIGLARPAQAAQLDEDGVLEANQTIDDDYFLTGETVRADGTVNGILVATGNNVTLNGVVNGDAFLFGQIVTVSEGAQVTGNLFVGAANIYVNGHTRGSIAAGSTSLELGDTATVGRNIYYGGFGLETAPGNTVERGIYVGAYQAILNGRAGGNLNASVGALRLNGSIAGDAIVEVGQPGDAPNITPYFTGQESFKFPDPIPAGIEIGKEAQIGGKLVYTSPVMQQQAIAAQPQGGVVYQTPVPQAGEPAAAPTPGETAARTVFNWIWAFLRTLATLLVLGLLAVWLIPPAMNRAGAAAQARPLESAGAGVLAFLGGYLGALVLAGLVLVVGIIFSLLTLGGLAQTVFGVGFAGLGLAVTALTVLVSYGAKLVVAYLIGQLILGRVAPEVKGRRYWAMVAGVVLYTLARSIPFLGWLIGVIVTLLGLGAIWFAWSAWRKERAAPQAAAAVN